MLGRGTPEEFSGCSILELVFRPHFLNIVVDVYALGPACLETVVGVSKGMLPEKSFCSNKASFCVSQFSW